MAYATVADLVARYTEPTIAGLTDLTRVGSVNAEIAQQGLDDASAEIDGYLASRYELPLPAPVRLLSLYCCDIAVYRLATGKRQLTEDMVHRYEAAIAYLKLVASGKAGLGVAENTDPKPTVQGDAVMFAAKEKVFGRDSVY